MAAGIGALIKYQFQKTDSLWGMLVGSFEVDAPSDTYLDMKGWGKGHVQVNGHNVGRYWSTVGPQVTFIVQVIHVTFSVARQ